MKKTKINRGFYPISYTWINRLIGYCNTWGYGNKDTCKYVAENITEQLAMNNPELPIRSSLNSDLISLAHDINNGRICKGELLIPINE